MKKHYKAYPTPIQASWVNKVNPNDERYPRLVAKIDELESELQDELRLNGNTKRAIFLKATINNYLDTIGESDRYSW